MSNELEYDLDALKVGVDRCHNNIKTFEDAISREHQTIINYKRMIAALEEKKALTNDNKNGRID